MSSIVEIDRLTKWYGDFAALDGCSLDVPQGSIFGLLGPNGAGKTTLIRCLLGYLKPTSGSARIDGINCLTQSVEVRTRVSYLPAESKLFRTMRGRDCIDFFASIHPRGNKPMALRMADRLELDVARRVGFMSTGMRQKLAICCVMSCESPVMILDEPTANLDPTVRAEVLRMVGEARERGSTILFCSHILSEIESLCDHAVILKQGEVVHSIDLHQLRCIHRIHALDSNGSSIPVQANVRVLSQDGEHVKIELDGTLDQHLGWLSSAGLRSIQVQAIGLQSVYERFHPGAPE